jgi:general secretion pathway protein I
LFRSIHRDRGGNAGFTLIEVLVTLFVLAVSLTAIGALIGSTIRSTHAIENRLALLETARGIMTGLPDRNELATGNFSGSAAGYRWRVDVLPFPVEQIDPQQVPPWVPQRVVLRVQSPAGQVLEINTIRLHRRPPQ